MPYNSISFLGIYPTEISMHIHQKAFLRMLIALCIIVPRYKLSKMPTNSGLEKNYGIFHKGWCAAVKISSLSSTLGRALPELTQIATHTQKSILYDSISVKFNNRQS